MALALGRIARRPLAALVDRTGYGGHALADEDHAAGVEGDLAVVGEGLDDPRLITRGGRDQRAAQLLEPGRQLARECHPAVQAQALAQAVASYTLHDEAELAKLPENARYGSETDARQVAEGVLLDQALATGIIDDAADNAPHCLRRHFRGGPAEPMISGRSWWSMFVISSISASSEPSRKPLRTAATFQSGASRSE